MEPLNPPELVQTGPEWFEAGLTYRVQMPDDPGPYPTVVMIHGRMGDEDVMWVFRKTIPRPWLVVAPRAPLPDGGAFSWHIQEPGNWPDLAAMQPAVSALRRFISALPGLYNADPDRIWLMGFSQGAALAISTAFTHPTLARGLAALAGFAPLPPPAEVDGRLPDLPVFMAAGTEDDVVPINKARAAAELLRLAGADLEYHEYRVGHKMTAAGMHDLRDWFTARR